MKLSLQNLSVLATSAAAVIAVAAAPQIASGETLKFGNEGNYPPFSITNADGSLAGLEPDLAAAVCAHIQAECDIVAMEFSAILPSLTAGKLDGIVTQLFPKPERLEVSEFTDPILENPMAWAVPASWDGAMTAAALDGVTIGTIKGNWAIEPLRRFSSGVEIREYDNISQIILELKAGRIDAGLAGRLNWLTALIDADGGDAFRLEATRGEIADTVEAYSWAMAKGRTDLRDQFNAALNELFENCTYTNIRKIYFSESTSSREPESCL